MNIDCFFKRFTDILMSDKMDSTFETINFLVGGTTSYKTGKLLNFAVSQMEQGECYVETGVFQGATLISANYRNGRKAYGIDPYIGMVERADALAVREKALQYIGGLGEGAQLIQKDFRQVAKEEIPEPIAVSFIDAMHMYQDVKDNLLWLEPLLADNALIFFDDVNYDGVEKAIFEWKKEHDETYDLMFHMKPFYYNNDYVWSLGDRFTNNGLSILRFHRSPAQKATYVHV